MIYRYKTKGTCSSEIVLDIENGRIKNVQFTGGCNGNLKGIAALTRGMAPADAAGRLSGIICGHKSTSCPDQLAKALKAFLAEYPQIGAGCDSNGPNDKANEKCTAKGSKGQTDV